ncbi:MAG: hypothetical protein CMJ49_00225 [Planctomycetaceae bacterium]|nr:hypothetical protein [Planctomycetaceae bacterium]
MRLYHRASSRRERKWDLGIFIGALCLWGLTTGAPSMEPRTRTRPIHTPIQIVNEAPADDAPDSTSRQVTLVTADVDP